MYRYGKYRYPLSPWINNILNVLYRQLHQYLPNSFPTNCERWTPLCRQYNPPPTSHAYRRRKERSNRVSFIKWEHTHDGCLLPFRLRLDSAPYLHWVQIHQWIWRVLVQRRMGSLAPSKLSSCRGQSRHRCIRVWYTFALLRRLDHWALVELIPIGTANCFRHRRLISVSSFAPLLSKYS